MVTEVERSVDRLTEQETAADGGTSRSSGGGSSEETVSIPEDLPDGMPEFVVDSLPDERLRAIARGEEDITDVM